MRGPLKKSKQVLGRSLSYVGITKTNLLIGKLRKQYWHAAPGSLINYAGYRIRITDGPSFYTQGKDEFIHQIYRFESTRTEPTIIDGGSNIGMSILYFKRLYPKARIIGFEPDPDIFKLLLENLETNNLRDVSVINAGLGAEAGTASFVADHSAGGRVLSGAEGINVEIRRLSDSIDHSVDFLKLNIEGEELPVLSELELSGKLSYVEQLVIEYHGWPDGEQRLGQILDLLARNGFRYMVHDFDNETGYATKPPFSWEPEKIWYCLIYAKNTSIGNAAQPTESSTS